MKKQKLLISLLAMLVIGSGIFIRFWQLDTIPPGIQYDEAYNGINAIEAIATGDYKVFYPENFGREGFHMNVTALFIKLFGIHNFTLRLANALWGSLTVLGFFLLLRELKLSRLAALMGTFMLSFSFWHLNFSRTAYRAIMVPLLLTWIFYFFFKGLHSKKYKFMFFALSGLMTGLGLHTYISFRVAPLSIVIIAFALLFTQRQFIRNYWKHALVYVFAALLAAAPILIYFQQNPADFSGRASAVSIFNAPGMTFVEALSRSLGGHLQSFFAIGDSNPRHNFNSQSTIPFAWSILLLIGFIMSVKEIIHTAINYVKKRKDNQATISTSLFYPSLLAQAIFWVMLIPGVLSIEGIPHALRIIGAIPGVFIFTALPFEQIHRLYVRLKNSETLALKPWRWNVLRVSMGGLVLIVLATGLLQASTYFRDWSNDPRTLSAFERRFYDLGLLVQQTTPKTHNYIITTENISVDQDHKKSSIKTVEYLGHPNITRYEFYKPLDGRFSIECTDALVVFQESDTWLRGQFALHCPNLALEEITPKKGMYSFWVLK